MTDTRIDEIRRCWEYATPGPWEDIGISNGDGSNIRDGVSGFRESEEVIICEVEAEQGFGILQSERDFDES